jgi:phenylacetate-CoA ligase
VLEDIIAETGTAPTYLRCDNGPVFTAAALQRAAPLLRVRSRDHARVWTGPCACGRTAPRVRCVGRTDDMLIVRGVNLFPTALREVVGQFAPGVSGVISIRPQRREVLQVPPLPVAVELSEGAAADAGLAERIGVRIRETLLVSAAVELVPWGSLPRSDYKSKLVDWSRAES